MNGLVVGDFVFIGKRCTIEVDGSIGSGCMIGNDVGIVGRRDHDIRCKGAYSSMSPWVGDGKFSNDNNSIVIEDDVWIGYGATVLSGITIARGAVIAAGSVVIYDVPAYAVVAGNPARVVSQRFSGDDINEHERLLKETGGFGANNARHIVL